MENTSVIDLLVAVGLGIVSVALISAFGLQLMGDVQDDMATCPTDYTLNETNYVTCYNATANVDILKTAQWNATDSGISGLAQIPGKLGIIVLAFIIVVVISVIKLIRG